MITGICAVLTGAAIVIWSIKYIHLKHGAGVFLALLILLTLVGGGIGHILLFLPVWAFTTRINGSLHWWENILPVPVRKRFSALWKYSLIATTLSWLVLMELGIFGYFPGQTDPDILLSIVYGFLFSSTLLACLSFICALSADLEDRIPGELLSAVD